MDKQKETLMLLEQLLAKLEVDLKRSRLLINQLINGTYENTDNLQDEKIEELATKLLMYDEDQMVKVIEGVYDGYFMIGSDKKKYPVPMNYSSKTKLIPGDVLKLRIMQDGKLVYKLIGPASKKYLKATLSKTDDNKYVAITDEGKNFNLNQAAVTFFKGNPGDELSIIINSNGVGDYAAIEAVINQ